MPKFQIEVWFDGMPRGVMTIEAKDELEALKKAESKTEHWVLGEAPKKPTKAA